MKPVAFSTVTLLLACVLQAVSSSGQAVGSPAQKPLKIDAIAGFLHLLGKPELAYPKEALEQHIEGRVELELTVSPQGEVVSERVLWGPPALRQAALDAFRKVKYIPFRLEGEPSVALVRAIVAYEKDQVTISTASEHALAEYKKYASAVSAGDAIQEASSTPGSGREGNGGDFGSDTGAHGRQMGNVTILSDTQGVDFGPYLHQVLKKVRDNWYSAIPESVQMKHGNLATQFAITRDGRVAGMRLVQASGDVPLDRAAWAGITGSDPFPPLPSEFQGQYLVLRFRFFYNPTKEEAAPAKPAESAAPVK